MPDLAVGHFVNFGPSASRFGPDEAIRSTHPTHRVSSSQSFFVIYNEKGTRMYAPTVDELLKPYRNYPKTIQTAILLVDTNPRFIGLTKGMKAVLKALLTRANVRDGTIPIKARHDIVAMEADVHEKTVQRTIARLLSAGWIERTTEGRSQWGVFTYRQYRFNDDLCRIVRLPVKGKTMEALPQETLMSDGAVYVDLSFKEDHQEILLQKRTNNPEANQITLPAALHQIVDLGVKASGVCKLRGMAHAKGHDLADIFMVAKKRIGEMKANGGRVFRYLAAMIDNPKPTDYASRARQIERSSTIAAIAIQTKDRTRAYAHKRFVGAHGLIIRIFDGIAEVIRDGQPAGMIAGRNMASVYDKIESGDLKEITA